MQVAERRQKHIAIQGNRGLLKLCYVGIKVSSGYPREVMIGYPVAHSNIMRRCVAARVQPTQVQKVPFV